MLYFLILYVFKNFASNSFRISVSCQLIYLYFSRSWSERIDFVTIIKGWDFILNNLVLWIISYYPKTLSGCLGKQSMRSRSAWAMAKMSTDVQAVIESLLWIVTACWLPFERLFLMTSRDLSRSTTVFRLRPARLWTIRHCPCAS